MSTQVQVSPIQEVQNSIQELKDQGIEEISVNKNELEAIQDFSENAVENFDKDIKNEGKESFEGIIKEVIVNFERTINAIRFKCEETLKEMQDKKIEDLNDNEKQHLALTYNQLYGIEELEKSTTINNYFNKHFSLLSDMNKNKSLGGYFVLRHLENKFVHKCRSVKVKKENVVGTLDIINNCKDKDLKIKLMQFYHIVLLALSNLEGDNKLINYKYYIVFQLGAIRLAANSYTSFLVMEEFYGKLNNTILNPNLKPFITEEMKNEVLNNQPEPITVP